MNNFNSGKKKISVVCPVFNEGATIKLYYERFQKATACLRNRYQIELIFINNCSTDNTLDEIKKLQSNENSIQYIEEFKEFI